MHIGVPQHNVTVPGVTVPTNLPSVGNLNPSTSPTHKSPAKKPTTKKSSASTSEALPGAGLSVPDMVVPQGNGNSVYGSSGGFQLNALPDNGSAGSGSGLHLTSPGQASGSSVTDPGLGLDTSGKHKTVDLASQNASPSSQLPVLLAILPSSRWPWSPGCTPASTCYAASPPPDGVAGHQPARFRVRYRAPVRWRGSSA